MLRGGDRHARRIALEQAREHIAATPVQHVAERIHIYILDLLRETRSYRQILLGASPRAGLHLSALARGWSRVHGRDHVLPDDVQAVTPAALSHRIVLTKEAVLQGVEAEDLISTVLGRVPVP